MRDRLERARTSPDSAGALKEIDELVDQMTVPELERHDLLVALLLAFRDLKAYDRIIEIGRQVTAEDRCPAVVQEQYAFALNRRNQPGDRARALEMLRRVIGRFGESPETCGLMGSIHKDAYLECLASGADEVAQAHLDEAIACYRRGFESDPRDYYPGINAATLLFAKGDLASLTELRDLLPVVVFSVGRRGGLQSHDYWDIATVLEASVLGEDWAAAARASARLATLGAPPWQYETTANNLTLIRRMRERRRLSSDALQRVVTTIEECAQRTPRQIVPPTAQS
jgi:tetratricopeptide (TPR) repeat protein